MDDQREPLSGEDGAAGFEVAWVRDGVEVRRPLADVAGVLFEEVAPVREFPSYRGQRNFPGLYWAATMLRHVGFESWLERDHAISMDFDPADADKSSGQVRTLIVDLGWYSPSAPLSSAAHREYGMMTCHAAALGLPCRDDRCNAAAPAATTGIVRTGP